MEEPFHPKPSTEYVRMYYEHQYDRMAQLEQQTFSLSNVVIAASIVMFTFGVGREQSTPVELRCALLLLLASLNAAVIPWLRGTYHGLAAHRRRARQTLELYAPQLADISNGHRFGGSRGALVGLARGRLNIQTMLHAFLLAAALMGLEFEFGFVGRSST